VLIPALFEAGMENEFWLNVYTEEAADVIPIPFPQATEAKGLWRGPSAGGCYNHPTFVNNPHFTLSFAVLAPATEKVKLTISLRQHSNPLRYVGFYIAKWSKRNLKQKNISRENLFSYFCFFLVCR
jgi:hypothetical protein